MTTLTAEGILTELTIFLVKIFKVFPTFSLLKEFYIETDLSIN